MVFVGSIVNKKNRSGGTNKSTEKRFAVYAICLFRATIHSPWSQRKRHSFLKKQASTTQHC